MAPVAPPMMAPAAAPPARPVAAPPITAPAAAPPSTLKGSWAAACCDGRVRVRLSSTAAPIVRIMGVSFAVLDAPVPYGTAGHFSKPNVLGQAEMSWRFKPGRRSGHGNVVRIDLLRARRRADHGIGGLEQLQERRAGERRSEHVA